MANKNFITLDHKQMNDYISHLKSLDYRSMNNGAASIVRQVANDIKSTYKAITPRRNSNKKSGKYGATGGNLQRSLRTFKKRQLDPFIVQYTVGFKSHAYGAAQAKLAQGKKVTDGYYGWMVSYGVAGRGKGRNSNPSIGFIRRARMSSNNIIDGQLSQRAEQFIERKLQKALVNKAKL